MVRGRSHDPFPTAGSTVSEIHLKLQRMVPWHSIETKGFHPESLQAFNLLEKGDTRCHGVRIVKHITIYLSLG